MSHYVFATWDGGGNVPVEIGMALGLTTLDHRVTFLGPEVLRAQVEEAGIDFRRFGDPFSPDPADAVRHLVCDVIGSPTLKDEMIDVVAELRPDALAIDHMLSSTIEITTDIPVVVLVSTIYGGFVEVCEQFVAQANTWRTAEHLEPLPTAAETWSSRELLLIPALAAFDPAPTVPTNAIHVGPVIHHRNASTTWSLPWDSTDDRPIVLASFSTMLLGNPPELLQRVLDGLADLPVRIIVTTGGAYPPTLLHPPVNAAVFDYIPHDALMPRGSIAITHGGHGTTMQALAHAVPLVCIPGVGLDQAIIANRVDELGLGIALEGDASPDTVAHAVTTLLLDRTIHQRTREFQQRFENQNGAMNAATALDNMLTANHART